MSYSESSAKDKLEKSGIIIMGKEIKLSERNGHTPGIKLLGAIDYLTKKHGYIRS